MNSYAIYRIVETIRIMLFVVLAMVFFNFYPITAIMIILLAFFNDVPIMAIAFDNTRVDPNPVSGNAARSYDFHGIGHYRRGGKFPDVDHRQELAQAGHLWEIQTFVFLKMAVAGHFTLFVTRTFRKFLAKAIPRADTSMVRNRHQGAGHALRGVSLRPHHPDSLARRGDHLGLLHRLALHG